MYVVIPGTIARFTALALASIIAAGACTTVERALVAGDPAVQAQTAMGSVAASPSPSPAPSPSATASPAPVPSPSPAATATAQPAAKREPEAQVSNAQRPKQKVVRLKPRPKPGPFEMNLYSRGDFMHQATKDMCVAGSTQIMMNIIDRGKPNRSVAYQKRLYQRGRELSPNKRKLGPIGVDLTGWAELLNTNGYGKYVVESAGTRHAAIRKAARAIRLTGRPVGLVVWRGAHSWVMSGFTATADPAHDKDFQVKAAYIQDTWYPYVSTIWGASNPPNTLVPVAKLSEDYLPYNRPRARYPARDGKFMLILPVLPKGTVAR